MNSESAEHFISQTNEEKIQAYFEKLDGNCAVGITPAQGIFTKIAEHYEHFETISFWLLGSRQRALISKIKQNEVMGLAIYFVEYTDTFVGNVLQMNRSIARA
ncbi:hypothetical protein R3P38DRAFT_2806893 [Favolaschia claudopus]|uniref:Uncharacterized protein n=1 Tax=Favolaschia claudopus TaxID=2862362 RepID=A0AAV9ZJB2_9AGAR